MKHTFTLLALTVGLSALNSMAQSEGDEARPSERPVPRREGERRIERGDRNTEPARAPREEAAPARRPNRPADRGVDAPTARSPRFGRGPGQFQPPGRGQGLGPIAGGPRRFQRDADVCPRCGRPFGPMGQAQRFGQGFRRDGQGPAWGPPPWAGRGGPQRDVRSGPQGQRFGGPALGWGQQRRMQQDDIRPPLNRGPGAGMGPMRRGFGGPGRDDAQLERGGPGPRPGGRGPARRPAPEADDR